MGLRNSAPLGAQAPGSFTVSAPYSAGTHSPPVPSKQAFVDGAGKLTVIYNLNSVGKNEFRV